MREAVGSSILFYIILMFIGIFIVFIAIIMNYAAAYRTNNYVVNMIEQSEGQDNFNSDLVSYLQSKNYNNGLIVTCSHNENGSVFHIKTYVTFYIPIIEAGFPLEINNDTKTIYTKYNNNFCNSSGGYYDMNYPSVGCWAGSGTTGISCY
ncbi:MAG: hypothetical protein IJ068_01190 [Bacilli bacterium]|nr:hypothetical protein [Bacilli bacterium]